MSVLYKALQKAEKENELRQSASSEASFDPQRLAASGALKFAGGRGQLMNRLAMGGVGLVAIAIGVAFVIMQDSAAPVSQSASQVAQVSPPSPDVNAVASPETAPPAATSSSEDAVGAAVEAPPSPGVDTQTAPSAAVDAAATTPAPEPSNAAAETSVAEGVGETDTKAAKTIGAAQSASAPAAAKPARVNMQRPEPMPTIAADSPTRMLSPPISVNRTGFELGVGDQVQVREVAASARSNAAAGYDALLRGSYDTALGFYDAALKEEPNSILAMLGRATSLQKLGRGEEAQTAYNAVLKMDPANREALTNLTSIVAERSPQEAITRLIELEREYPAFSPIKAQIGLAYAKSGSMQQALDYLGRAVNLAPETVMYHYNLALVLDHLGRKEQAVASYERVLASLAGGRGPTELSANEIERRVQFLRAR